jgi:cell division protein FtsB
MSRATPAERPSTTCAEAGLSLGFEFGFDFGLPLRMRYVSLALIALIALVQAELWFGKGGVPRMMELRGKLTAQQATNATDKTRNAQLMAEVSDLKEGLEMVEEKARFELGMVKPDEIFVQVSTPKR